MNHSTDGYELYRLLSDGQPHSVEVNGSTYRFQFQGHRTGSNNWLEVTPGNGTSKKWGWGWSSEVCWQCLQDLERGWKTPQRHPFQAYVIERGEEQPLPPPGVHSGRPCG